jgi:hypothetical protein
MQQQQQVSATQQVQHVTQQLTQALIAKEDARVKLEDAEKAIVALRNVLAGVQVGQQLEREVIAEKAAQVIKTPSAE